jgi:hypothetical protein
MEPALRAGELKGRGEIYLADLVLSESEKDQEGVLPLLINRKSNCVRN